MLLLGRENGESWARVSRVRVSKLWEPNSTVKESMQRATSERTVMMRVELIVEDGIVRDRFSSFSFFFPGGPREKRTGKKREERLNGNSTRAFI